MSRHLLTILQLDFALESVRRFSGRAGVQGRQTSQCFFAKYEAMFCHFPQTAQIQRLWKRPQVLMRQFPQRDQGPEPP